MAWFRVKTVISVCQPDRPCETARSFRLPSMESEASLTPQVGRENNRAKPHLLLTTFTGFDSIFLIFWTSFNIKYVKIIFLEFVPRQERWRPWELSTINLYLLIGNSRTGDDSFVWYVCRWWWIWLSDDE